MQNIFSEVRIERFAFLERVEWLRELGWIMMPIKLHSRKGFFIVFGFFFTFAALQLTQTCLISL